MSTNGQEMDTHLILTHTHITHTHTHTLTHTLTTLTYTYMYRLLHDFNFHEYFFLFSKPLRLLQSCHFISANEAVGKVVHF